MATIKAFSDLQQSKKLAEFLPIESADMVYIWHATSDNPTFRFDDDMPPMVLKDVPISEITADTLPCWSLAALLSVLPIIGEGKNTSNPFIAKTPRGEYYVVYATLFKEIDSSDIYSNPIDACYEMIIKLHEQNLL